MKTYYVIIFLMVCGAARAQQKEAVNPDGAVLLDAAVFKEKLASEPEAVLIDVRTPGEIKDGMIPGAIMIDYNAPTFASKLAALDKDKTYFVYCKVGGRSGMTTEQMKSAGFQHVHDLKGGYLEWSKRGFATTKP